MKISKEPTWYEGIDLPRYQTLAQDEVADVVIIGGGITGVTSAYLLAKKGLRVVLIEKDRLGSGATGATTAFLSSIIDTDLSDLVSMLGTKRARAVINSHQMAIDVIEEIVRSEKIECEFARVPSFIFAAEESQVPSLESEYDAGHKVGLEMKKNTAPQHFKNFGVIEVADQAKFHPLKYLRALAQIATDNGAKIYELTCAESVEETDAGVVIKIGDHSITASNALYATYEPFTKPLSLYFKKAFYTSYVIEATIPKRALTEGTYEDLSNPYCFFRVDPQELHDRLIIGGEDHRSDVHVSPQKNFKALEDYVKRTFEGLDYTITRKWSGPILEPIDGLAYIGPWDKYGYVAMAFSGNGMTYGTIAAMMFRDFIAGNGSPWTSLYDPSRIPDFKKLLIKGRDYLTEFFNGAVKNTATYDKD